MSDPGRDGGEGGLLRGVLGILLVGLLLGVGFNALGRSGKPVRGLPWIGEDKLSEMPTLSELAGDEVPLDPAAPEGGYTRTDDPMAVGGATAATGVPEIPALDRPIQIELAAVKALFDAQGAVLVDAREPDEYREGHIPGSLSMPFDAATAEPERLEALETAGRPIIVYCGGGDCELSLSLAWELIHAGQTRVTVYMGGYPEWVEAGYPVATGA